MKLFKLLTLLISLAMLSTAAFSATFNLYTGAPLTDRTDFLTDLGGAPTLTQDFQVGYLHEDDLDGVYFLPGVYVTSNMENVIAWLWSGDFDLFGLPRGTIIDDYYDIHFDEAYKAVGFDIDSFDPSTPGPGYVEVNFIDGVTVIVSVYPTNATETDPVFFGVISDTPIHKIRWTEGPETGGGNEETTLDNFVVSRFTIEVGVDIKFCSDPNAFNCKKKGVLPVTVFGTDDFDVTAIDPSTLKLCLADLTTCTNAPRDWSIADRGDPTTDIGAEQCAIIDLVEQDFLTQDGIMDFDAAFEAVEVRALLGDFCEQPKKSISQTLFVVGETFDGVPIVSVAVDDEAVDQLWKANK